MTRLREGSLFTGTNALGMAAASALDCEPTWFADIDPGASALLAHHYPNTPNLGDITKVDWTTVEPIDVLTAGFPCQDVSLAGKRAGLKKGTRTGLWSEVVRAIAELRPRYVLLENVAGLFQGGWDDDPNDRCVCGWSYRRGGLHRDLREEGDLQRPGGCGDDSEGPACPEPDASGVRGNDPADAPGDEALGRGGLLGGERAGSGDVPGADLTASADQGGAGANWDAGRADPARAASPEGHCGEVDGGSPTALRCVEEAIARAESEGAFDPATGEPVTVCPFCGWHLGDGPSRSVFRSGVSAVLGDLAPLGFHARWVCIRASDVGAPHRRERFFLAAVAEDADCAARGERRLATPGQAQGRRPRADARGRGRAPATDTVGLGRRASGRNDGIRAARLVAEDDGQPAGPAAADAAGDGRGEGRTEPARLIRGPDAAQRGAPPAYTDRGGLARHQERDLESEAGLAAPLGQNADGRLLDWGEFTPAIRQWEAILRRPAPAPTVVGTRGGRVLNPALPEWMMGLPDGWITAVPGLTRNQQLKLAGNGVVVQQGIAAASYLFGLLGVTLAVAA